MPAQHTPAGIVITGEQQGSLELAEHELLNILTQYGLSDCSMIEVIRNGKTGGLGLRLEQNTFERLCPDFQTLDLHGDTQGKSASPEQALAQETLIALLAAPKPMVFSSVQVLESHLRVRLNIAQAAAKTSLAFHTEAAERPLDYWVEHPEHGFILRPDASLIEAIVAATQPEHTGRLYDFSCYRASEYLVLLGIAQEAQVVNPQFLAALEAECRIKVPRSGIFHEKFLIEYGSSDDPVPMKYYVPGDRVWFKNPDIVSSNIIGFEGSWVFYMGRGLFSNFWNREQPFDLESKCLEVFHWRDGACKTIEGEVFMNEEIVAQQVAQTRQDPVKLSEVMKQMMAYRDPLGVYEGGGCIDSTREFPKPMLN